MTEIKLTPKQERFVQNVFKGMSQREAYKDAYKTKRMSDNAIDREACVMMKSPKISQRYQQLVDKLEKKTIMTAEERMEWLSKVITGDIKEVEIYKETNLETGKDEIREKEIPSQLSTKLKAMDTLNKMTGEYTTKVEGDLNVTKLEDLL